MSLLDLYGLVAFDFQPSVPDELELQVGNAVKIIKDVDQFWYYGQNLHDGKTGQFPKDFVNLITLPATKPGENLMLALDDFYPEVKDDLPFKKGDVIVMSHKVDESWGYGECHNRHGIFPLNYTQRLVTSEPTSSAKVNDSKTLCTVTATMPLSAQLDEELSFEVGDEITVTEIMPDGWAIGQNGNQSGSFPLSFTSYQTPEKWPKKDLITATNPAKPIVGDTSFKQSNVQSTLTDDALRTSSLTPLDYDYSKHLSLPEEPPPILSHHEQSLRESNAGISTMQGRPNKSSLKGHASISSGSDSGYGSYSLKDQASTKQTIKRFVIANFSHFGRNSDELSFKEGDVIEVLDVKSEMWLLGKLRGSTGLVPENYVSDYILSQNGHSELSNANLLEKIQTIQQHGTSQQKDHAKQALVNMMKQHDDVRLVVEDFKASTDFELSINVGDIVHVLQEINEKWFEVKNNRGNIGFVPCSCLERVKASASTNKKPNLATNVQRSQTFVVKKSAKPEAHKEKLSRAISCQPAISSDKPSTSDNASSPISSRYSDEKPSSSVPISPSSSSSSLSEKGRRHSYHNKENSKQRAVVRNRALSEKRRNSKASKSPSDVITDRNFESILGSDSSLTVASSKNWENDSSSITSRDSSHSNHLPSSSCSTDSSESATKRKSNNSRNLALDSELSYEHKVKKANRVAPPPPSVKIDNTHIPETPSIPQHERTPPIRPPQPAPKQLVSNQSEEVKLSSAEQKVKIEKIRSEIEEYSRMQKSLETMYQSTLDGKVRQEISEDKQFVVVKLKRLQKELHDLIATDTSDTPVNSEPLPVVGSDPPAISPAPPIQDDRPTSEEIVDIKEKRRVKRNHVIRELIKTEEDFLQDVVITINDIMKPLVERELPLDIKLDIVFGNIEEIRDFSKKLLTSLKKADTETNDNPVSVGSVFIEHSADMKEVYKLYCRNHDDATALLEKYDDDPEFQAPVQEYLNHVKNKVNTFDLGSFLIKPVQRILKYPLLLHELLKLSDVPGPGDVRAEYDELIQAVKLVQEAANDINEDKRRKDLVRKYRKGSQDANLVGKFSRISLHSVKKKSARISLRLGHVTGLNQPETVDETFNALEQRFKDLEKAIKAFLQNSDLFGNRYRDLLNLERLLLEHISDVWASDHTDMVESYGTAMRRIADHLYRQFHNRTQLQVHTPLNALLLQFKGPQSLIEKRFDKLLDYENCQKSSDSKDKTQMAKNVYEALNHQLIDELPVLCDLGYKLLDACINLFLSLQIRFQTNMLEVAEPVLRLCVDKLQCEELDKKTIMERFNSTRNQAMVEMRNFTIIPSTFTAVTSSFPSGHASPNTSRITSQGTSTEQPSANKEVLQKRYKSDDLFVATTGYKSDDKMSLSCSAGDLVGVIKRQDPLGSASRWFCDDGVTQGFLPSKILKSKSQQPKRSPAPRRTSETSHSSSTTTMRTPSIRTHAAQTRRKSPTPSSQSSGLSDKSSSSSIKLSPNTVKFTRNTSVEDECLEDKSKLSVDLNKLRMKAYWDRKKLTDRQKFRLDFHFSARSTLELSVREGEVVDLVEQHDMDGNVEWWLVANAEGKQGYVPANYMSKIEYL